MFKLFLPISVLFIIISSIYFLRIFNENNKIIHRKLNQSLSSSTALTPTTSIIDTTDTATNIKDEFNTKKCERWYSKFGIKKRHLKNNNDNLLYSIHDNNILIKLADEAKLELPKLIKYAYDNYDMKTMLKTFYENGYLIFKPKIDNKILDDATNFTQLLGDNHPSAFNGPFTRGHSCLKSRKHCIHDRYDQNGVSGIANDFSIRAVIAALFEMNPYSYQSLNYPRSSLAATHSDYIHFGSYPANTMCAVWVALEDIHPDAGPLFYYPGSHKLPYINMNDFDLKTIDDGDYPIYQTKIETLAENLGFKKTTFLPKRGEALIWHGNLLHGGPTPNNKEITRLSQVVHYHFYEMEYGWHPIASRIDENKIKYVNNIGVHQIWGRIPAEIDTIQNKDAIGSCFHFPNSPCLQNLFSLGLSIDLYIHIYTHSIIHISRTYMYFYHMYINIFIYEYRCKVINKSRSL